MSGQQSAHEALRAEAENTGPAGVSVQLVTEAGEFDVVVPPPGKWKSRANGALRDGDFEGWAELVLSPEDYEAWVEADPTNDEVTAFFTAWQAASGEDSGKSRASKGSSRRTARR